MFNWLKSLFVKPVPVEIPKKRPRLYKQAVVVTKGELPQPKEKKMAKNGLYANIHKKQERIEKQKAAGGKVNLACMPIFMQNKSELRSKRHQALRK
jgi:hypothetical protein